MSAEAAARESQYEIALRELRSLILQGEFEASSRLAETAIAERVGVSRTPLRQAMSRLVEESLLERLPNGGCRVASFTMDDIVDAIEVRGVLEGTAARIAAERGVDDDLLETCEQVLSELDVVVFGDDGLDFDRYVPLNARFHELLSTMPGSKTIEREIARATRLPLASPSAFLQGQQFVPDFQHSLRVAQGQHRSILDAIGKREGARADALAREHARLARANLEFFAASDGSLIDHVPGLSLVEGLLS